MRNLPTFTLLEADHWQDYELLDSGDGLKLERFGKYTFARPESQAMWSRALPKSEWDNAHGVFIPTGEESGGHWQLKKKVDDQWVMSYPLPDLTQRERGLPSPSGEGLGMRDLKFSVMTTPGRHLGVFPEVAAHWDFMADTINGAKSLPTFEDQRRESLDSRPNVLNLFGYTGLATLTAAAAGASVTHVDASKKSVSWARENQELSGLSDRPIRWIVEDALKYVQREVKRGVKYDGVILDPPKFGRGPKGEVWEVYKSLPNLLDEIRQCLSDHPLFVVVTVYAVRASAIHVAQAVDEMMKKHKGTLDSGELVTREKSANRLLSQAVYARWSSQ